MLPPLYLPCIYHSVTQQLLMLSGASECRTNFKKIVVKIMALDYKLPSKLKLSEAVHDLLAKIFVKDPRERITIQQIKKHPWYLHRLPAELMEGYKGFPRCRPVCTPPSRRPPRLMPYAAKRQQLEGGVQTRRSSRGGVFLVFGLSERLPL